MRVCNADVHVGVHAGENAGAGAGAANPRAAHILQVGDSRLALLSVLGRLRSERRLLREKSVISGISAHRRRPDQCELFRELRVVLFLVRPVGCIKSPAACARAARRWPCPQAMLGAERNIRPQRYIRSREQYSEASVLARPLWCIQPPAACARAALRWPLPRRATGLRGPRRPTTCQRRYCLLVMGIRRREWGACMVGGWYEECEWVCAVAAPSRRSAMDIPAWWWCLFAMRGFEV